MADLTHAASLQLGALQLQLSGREHATPVGGSSIANEINAALAAGLQEAYVASTADAAPALTPAALTALRRELGDVCGLVLVVGPPCAGKSEVAASLAVQLGATHACLPTLLQEGAAAPGPDGDVYRDALLGGAILAPAALLDLLRRAAQRARDALLLLECPAHSALLPSALLALPPPLLLLVVDAPDRLCVTRLRRRGVPSVPQALELLRAHRAVDEPVAKAFGAAYPGRLCVLAGGRAPTDETPSAFCAALHRARREAAWLGAADPRAPPLLVLGGGGGGHARAVATRMAERWRLAALCPAAPADAAAPDVRASGGEKLLPPRAAAAGLAEALRAEISTRAAEGLRCVVHHDMPAAASAAERLATLGALLEGLAGKHGVAACAAFVVASGDRGEEAALEQQRSVLGAAGVAWHPLPHRIEPALAQAAAVLVAEALSGRPP